MRTALAGGNKKMLAQYSIPLGANEATLVFTGDSLAAGDFEALIEFVEFAKKQFERKQKAQEVANVFANVQQMMTPKPSE